MAVKIQIRRDTAANWSSNNPTLDVGELGLDITNNIIKAGDGTTAWNSLSDIAGVEHFQDVVGAMVTGNTESGISVTYDDATGKLNFNVGDPTLTISGDATASAAMTDLGNTDLAVTLADTAVTAGSYGSASQVPVITVDSKGRLTSATTASVSAITDFDYNTATGVLDIDTADGGNYTATVTLAPFDTGDLAEGSNQYFTDARVMTSLASVSAHIIPDTNVTYDLGSSTNKFRDLYLSGSSITLGAAEITESGGAVVLPAGSQISGQGALLDASSSDTDDLSEGSSNLYFTNERVDDRVNTLLQAGSNVTLTYDDAANTLTISSVDTEDNLSNNDTDDLSEGSSNLYHTTARARAAISENSTQLAYNSGTGVMTFTQGDTDTVSEGSTNQYHTVSRGRSVISASGSLAYNSTTGVMSFTEKTASEIFDDVVANDGAGSGLDADKLDGQHGSYYAAASQVLTDVPSGAVFTDTDTTYSAGNGISLVGTTFSASNIAVTTVQEAANETAHLALTAQEGDVVIRSDESKSYIHNGGSAGTMADYTVLATPTDSVLSVNGSTGAVVLTHDGFSDFVANEHIDWTASGAGTIHASNYTDTNTTYSVQDGELSQNNFTNADHSKLDGIEASADVTDATNVAAAGALMDSEVTNLAAVKAFDSSDYATAAQGTTADNALPKAGGTLTGVVDSTNNANTDGHNFLVTTTNKSEVLYAYGVDRNGVESGLTVSGVLKLQDDQKIKLGTGNDLQIYHDGSNSIISDVGTGNLKILAQDFRVLNSAADENMISADQNGSVKLYHNNALKLATTSTGIDVTGNVVVTGTVDGRDVATDGTKLDGIEASADVTDATNVTAAGALMDSEVTNLAQVKAFDSSDYATAAQGTTADAALPKAGGAMTGALQIFNSSASFGKRLEIGRNAGEAVSFSVEDTLATVNYKQDETGTQNHQLKFNIESGSTGANGFIFSLNDTQKTFIDSSGIDITGNIVVSGTVDGRDVATDGTKLDGIESGALAISSVRGALSVTDSGGDGSLSYNSGTGVVTYTGPSASDVRAHFSGGTGVSISSGTVAIGQAVGTSDDVTFGTVDTGVLEVDSKKILDMPSNSNDRGPWNPLVTAMRNSGTKIYRDEDFNNGMNSVSTYNNSGGGTVAITRVTDSSESLTAPNTSGYVLKIVNNGGTTSPGLGGFIQPIASEENHTFVQIFQAKFPTGYDVVLAENAQGTNGTSYWMTNTAGTGKWEWYARVSHCGDSGTFNGGGHVYLSGSAGAVTWHLASCTVVDVSESQDLRIDVYDSTGTLLN